MIHLLSGCGLHSAQRWVSGVVKEFVEVARKTNGKLLVASSGVGSTQHLALERFKIATSVDMIHVPYKGSGPAVIDLIGGQVDANFDGLAVVAAHRPNLFQYINAAQLVKHAFGLRTQSMKRGVQAVLAYVYAEPSIWPDGVPISQDAHAAHVEEVRCFARMVAGADVQFMHFSYCELVRIFAASPLKDVREHASRLRERFHIV